MRTDVGDSEIKYYLNILWRWMWLIVFCTIMSAAVSYFLSSITTPVYRASTTLLIDNARSAEGTANYNDLLFIERLSQTWAQLMERKSTVVKIAERLDIDEETLFNEIVDRQVTPIRNTQLMRIDIESVSPTLAALVANTMPVVFVDEISNVQTERFGELKLNLQNELDELDDQIFQIQVEINELSDSRTVQEDLAFASLQGDLSELQDDRRNLRTQLESIRLTEAQSTDSIGVVEAAEVPETPIRPRTIINTLIAAVVGAMAATGFVFMIEVLDNRSRTPNDLKNILDVPLLGAISVIPKKGRTPRTGIPDEILIALREPRNPLTEAYRGIRTNLQFASIDMGLRTLMVTSAVPGEGKSTTAANLAIVMAQAGYSVVLIDADMRKPNIHKLFSIQSRPGVVDAILADHPAPLSYSPNRLIPNLKILPVGKRPPNPAELLGSQRMKNMLERICNEADLVVIDAPPLLAVTDAQILSRLVDKVLLVVGSGTDKGAVQQAAEALKIVDAPFAGYVFNRLQRSAQNEYYYYSEYYGELEKPPTASGPTLEIPVHTNGHGKQAITQSNKTIVSD